MAKKDKSFFGKLMGDVQEAQVQMGYQPAMQQQEETEEVEELVEDQYEEEDDDDQVVYQEQAQEPYVSPELSQDKKDDEWLSDFEGQLNIDMYQTKDNVIIKS